VVAAVVTDDAAMGAIGLIMTLVSFALLFGSFTPSKRREPDDDWRLHWRPKPTRRKRRRRK